jgi:hypothetical protein
MFVWAGIAQLVRRLATGWTNRGSSPFRGENFRTCPDRTRGQPSILYSGYRVFPWVKRPGRSTDHPPHLAVRLRKACSYICTSPLGLRCLFQGEIIFTYYKGPSSLFWLFSQSTSLRIIVKYLTYFSFNILSINIINPIQQTSSDK